MQNRVPELIEQAKDMIPRAMKMDDLEKMLKEYLSKEEPLDDLDKEVIFRLRARLATRRRYNKVKANGGALPKRKQYTIEELETFLNEYRRLRREDPGKITPEMLLQYQRYFRLHKNRVRKSTPSPDRPN